MQTAESDANLRRALIEAKWARRYHQREFGPQTSLDLVHGIRKAAWLSERIRVEGPQVSEERLRIMRLHLLRTLAAAELVAIDLLGDPFQAAKCSK